GRVTFRTTMIVTASAAVLVGIPRSTIAQTAGPRRPSDGLLFTDRTDPDVTQRMDVTVSSAAGYDTDAGDSREEHAFVGNGLGPAGLSTTVVAAGDYSWSGRRGQFRASGISTFWHYRDGGDLVYSSSRAANHAAAVGFSLTSRKTTFSVNQTGSYAS